uniref:Uncharacterized protein TCIL3000_10_13690 n=1 Tax=Trypanosoma congolense (strain IL3000) TaxID=1068625 RepID=G0UYW6_TRYCI|nr:unnamed protein product [Trypanosoma congolense IL3000]
MRLLSSASIACTLIDVCISQGMIQRKAYNNPFPALNDGIEVILQVLHEKSEEEKTRVEMLPNGATFIGFGAFGTVRLGWLQERRRSVRGPNRRIHVDIGTVAAVAVKRVAVPGGAMNSLDFRRSQLLRELHMMECIKMFPHPNVVQCWGFVFYKKSDDQPTTGKEDASPLPGEVLTSLCVERQRHEINTDCVGEVKATGQILEGISHFDVCLSLCTGGTLSEYVRRITDTVLHTILLFTQKHRDIPTKSDVTTSLMEGGDEDQQGEGLTGSTNDETTPVLNEPSCEPTPAGTTVGHGGRVRGLSSPGKPAFVVTKFVLGEKDITAMSYALCNALRHTHEVMRTLHRDVKPANILICDGKGKVPSHLFGRDSPAPSCTSPIPQGPSTESGLLRTTSSSSVVELSLCSDLHEALGDFSEESADEEKEGDAEKNSDVLVVPSEAGAHHMCGVTGSSNLPLVFLPQSDAWRLQLADYGTATGRNKLDGNGRYGTFPFMAPEVGDESYIGSAYGPSADIYSLGVTMQYTIIHTIAEVNEWGEVLPKRTAALGMQWTDEDMVGSELSFKDVASTGEAEKIKQSKKGVFELPSEWRCAWELGAGDRVREGALSTTDPAQVADDLKKFRVPRSWRCHDELTTGWHIRQDLSTEDATNPRYAGSAHEAPQSNVPKTPGNVQQFNPREDRRVRCRSCRKLHRNVIELLNAMTSPDPAQRPSLPSVMCSAAIIEQGTFVNEREGNFSRALWGRGRSENANVAGGSGKVVGVGRDDGTQHPNRVAEEMDPRTNIPGTWNEEARRKGSLLWRPPSLRFLSRQCEKSWSR